VADAYRHCYWSCRLTQVLGGVKAYIIWSIHEICDPLQSNQSRDMDIANNVMGMSIGVVNRDCDTECRDLLGQGKLTIINHPTKEQIIKSIKGLPILMTS